TLHFGRAALQANDNRSQPMSRIEVAVLVGTSVPESLRSKGLLACWILMVDGAMWAGPFTSRDEAEALKGTWELSWPLEAAISA
ncbi:hypothetical protein ACLBUN_33870, partial [Pseudomonas aeruginosa]|uniref:hypothetical protein n=4 Tax=Pseudomonas aeruginosa TaxID=287 RepID=UPI003969B4B0